MDSGGTCHGVVTCNAAVEGGFSINKELLSDNMLEETVVAQKVMFDAIRKVGMDIKNVDITLNMGMSAAHRQGISECLESGHPDYFIMRGIFLR